MNGSALFVYVIPVLTYTCCVRGICYRGQSLISLAVASMNYKES